MNAKQFIDKVKGSSNILWNTYKILPSVAIAQACLESGWGSSSLATKYNNLFGIKGSFNGQTTNMKTWESYGGVRYDIVANFRSYPDWETSIKDYGVFLNVNSRYKNALGIKDPKQQIKAIHEAGYATDPNYQNKIMAIITVNNLTQYDSVVKGNQVSGETANVSSTLYVVRSGDNLSSIAQKYKTTVNEIVRLNNIKNPNLIQVGQKLTINGQSPMKMHVVQSGDTVSELALKYGSSQSQIKGWNNLANINVISIGQKLRVK